MATSPSNPLGFAPVGAPSSAQSSAPDPSNPLGFAPIGSQRVSTSQEESPQNISQPSDSNPLGFAPVGAPSEPVQKTDNQPPPDEGLLAKTWRLANTPITEDLGLPQYRQGAGGFERGGEKILSGFTSPLSLMLTIGTLGTAGFLESAGANVLKETLMAGADGLDEAAATAKAAQFSNAAKAATDAYKVGNPVSKAVEATGMDYNNFKSLQNMLYSSGLREADITSGNIVQRGTFNAFKNLGVDAVQAQKIAKGTELAMNAGFTAQQLHSAIHTIPQVLDDFADGNYDDAEEHMTEAAVNSGFGLLGLSHALHSAGQNFASLNPDELDRLKPTDENQKLHSLGNDMELKHQTAEQTSQKWMQDIRKRMGYKDGFFPTVFKSKAEAAAEQERLDRLVAAVDIGNNPEKARQLGNFLADATGQSDKKIEAPEGTQTTIDPTVQKLAQDHDLNNIKLSPKAKAQATRLMNAWHSVAKGLSPEDTEIYNRLRERDNQNGTEGLENGVLTNYIQNHFHHVYEGDIDGNANILMHDIHSGKLDTNVSQAKHRAWETLADAALRGKKIVGWDPVAVIGKDLTAIHKAAATREYFDNIRDENLRSSDGRPMVAFSGQGNVVQSDDGSNPVLLINQNRLRNASIADSVVNSLQKSGDLARQLASGDIRDVTPKVYPNNIDQFIAKFENKAQSQNAQYDAEGNNILRKDIETLKGVKNGTLPASALDEINNRQKSVYVYHPQGYVIPASTALSDWHWITKIVDPNDPTSETPVLVKDNIAIHPEVAPYLINRLGLEKSYLRENKGIGKFTKPILEGGKEAKSILLTGSPFHLNQIFLRAIQTGINPFQIKPIDDIETSPELKSTIKGGLTLYPDRQSLEDYSSGVAQHSKLLSKIPIIGKALDFYQHFLFNRVIPAYKADAAKVMWKKIRAANPDWSDDAVGRAAGQHVNNAFGGQNWRALGRAASTQDWFHILALAPDWLESEMRFAASTMRGKSFGNKNFSRDQVLKMAGGLWLTARVVNMMNSGNMHLEAPFGFVTKDKDGREIVHSIRTLPTDILHMASDPAGFLTGRMSPFARVAKEAVSGRDTFGRKLAPGDLAIDIGRNMVPIPAQAIGQIASGDTTSVGNAGQLAKSAGVTARVYRTEGEKLATQLSSEHDDAGPLDPAKLHKYEVLSKLEDGLRSGSITTKDLDEARDFGPLSPDDHKKIMENLKLTQGLDPELARMVTKVHRLPATDALKVWDASTPKEKTALVKVLIKKKQSYIQNAMKKESPQERLNDPTFRRLRLMFQEGTPQSENQFPPAIIPQKKYPMTAVNDQGHRIGSHNGQDWFDHETDEPISA